MAQYGLIKVCTKCGLEKDREKDFVRDSSRADGKNVWCKDCKKLQSQSPSHRAQQQQYRKEHPEITRRAVAKFARVHPERNRQQHVDSRKRNTSHKDAYYRRRVRLKGGEYEKVDKRVLYERDNGLCKLCGLPVTFEEATIDHIHPIALGGGHTYDNTQIAHLLCNMKKGIRT